MSRWKSTLRSYPSSRVVVMSQSRQRQGQGFYLDVAPSLSDDATVPHSSHSSLLWRPWRASSLRRVLDIIWAAFQHGHTGTQAHKLHFNWWRQNTGDPHTALFTSHTPGEEWWHSLCSGKNYLREFPIFMKSSFGFQSLILNQQE